MLTETEARSTGLAESPAYGELATRFRRLAGLDQAAALLRWDEAAMMPSGSGESRARQLVELAQLAQERLAAPDMGDLLETAEEAAQSAAEDDPDAEWHRANLRRMRRRREKMRAVSPELLRRAIHSQTVTEQSWRELKPKGDWQNLAPLLDDVVAIRREVAEARAEHFECGRYDALLDDYEPGLTFDEISLAFKRLETELPALVQALADAQQGEPAAIQPAPVPIARQRDAARELAKLLGFDFDRGRLDESLHPFCGGTPADVRMTVRYLEERPWKAMSALLHESGHGRYQQGLPVQWHDQPVGRATSMGVHESQSLLTEMQIGRSPIFLQMALPKLRQWMGIDEGNPAWTAENISRLNDRVEPGPVRIQADAVSYPLHIVIRTGIERDLIEGDLKVADLPGVWEERMWALLGTRVDGSASDGVMQDVHWPSGKFGYFPTYALGAVLAAQLMAAMRSEIAVDDALADGDFTPINEWCRENIWQYASRYSSVELIRRCCGTAYDPTMFLDDAARRLGQNAG